MNYFSQSEIAGFEQRFRTNFVNSLAGFRSLNLVGTINMEGNENLAIFNSIFHVGANPALIGMLVRPDGPEHGTLKNIIANQQYTLNNVLKSFYKNAHQTSARYDANTSEFAACGFKSKYVAQFSAPFVAESTIQIGLNLQEVLPIKSNGTTLIIGAVQHVFLADSILQIDGFANPEIANTITNCGLDAYYEAELIARLSYAKPEKELNII